MTWKPFAKTLFDASFRAFFAVAFFASATEGADPKVQIVSVPTGGRAMSAKLDSKGDVHLVYDTPQGPHYLCYDPAQAKFLNAPIPLVDSASRKPDLEFITWDMAVAADGTVHVILGNNAWKLKLPKDEWGAFYTRRLPSEKRFTPLKNINRKPSEGFSLAVHESGVVTAVWMADKLYANVSHDGGNLFGETIEIDPQLNPCNCCTTSSVYGADRRLAILYREETSNERDMYLALWDQKSNTVTKKRVSTVLWKIDSCPMTYYSLVRNGEGYLAAWPTRGEIYFAKLDASGSMIESNETRTSGRIGMRSGILPIAINDRDTVVVWKRDNQLLWKMYDRLGQPGPEGSEKSEGTGVAAVRTPEGPILLFR